MTYYGIEGSLIDNIIGILVLAGVFGIVGCVVHVVKTISRWFKR